jgi:hypothetical protein
VDATSSKVDKNSSEKNGNKSDQPDEEHAGLAEAHPPKPPAMPKGSTKVRESQPLHNIDYNEQATQGYNVDGDLDELGDGEGFEEEVSEEVQEFVAVPEVEQVLPAKRQRINALPEAPPAKRARADSDGPQEREHRAEVEPVSNTEVIQGLSRLLQLLEQTLRRPGKEGDCDVSAVSENDGEGGSSLREGEQQQLVPRRAQNSVIGGGVRSHPKESDLSEEGKEARRVLEEYFGAADNFHPLTYKMQRADREEITRTVDSTEVFFPVIREIEKPMGFGKFNENEKERRLYNHVCFMKQMYELEMPVIFYLANGELDMACKCAAQLIELTLDSATVANEQRFKLRVSPAVANSISHVGEEPVYQEGYRVIAEEKANEIKNLKVIADGQSSTTRVSLPKVKVIRDGWVTRTASGETRGVRYSSQSRSGSTNSFNSNPTYHRNAGNSGSNRNRQEKPRAQLIFQPKSNAFQTKPTSYQRKK